MKILFFAQRNIGDAVILNSFLQQLKLDDMTVDIVCKKEFKGIFQNSSSIRKIVYLNFPIAAYKRWNFFEWLAFFIHAISENYDIILDYFGDFREQTIGYFCRGKKFITVEREEGHPFNNLIRRGLGFMADEKIVIPANLVNIYDQIRFVFEHVGLKFKDCDKVSEQHNKDIVGVHPFASQECKFWEQDKWRLTINKLHDNSVEKIYIFGAPQERKILEQQFGDLVVEKIEIFTGTLTQFMDKLKELDVLVGLDSFSVHAAYAAGVPNIMICGANDYRMWQTPLTKVVAPKENSCPYWPCYNKPKCNGEYGCIKSISVEDVIAALQKMGGGRPIRIIGLHPFASQGCRRWPWGKWRELVR